MCVYVTLFSLHHSSPLFSFHVWNSYSPLVLIRAITIRNSRFFLGWIVAIYGICMFWFYFYFYHVLTFICFTKHQQTVKDTDSVQIKWAKEQRPDSDKNKRKKTNISMERNTWNGKYVQEMSFHGTRVSFCLFCFFFIFIRATELQQYHCFAEHFLLLFISLFALLSRLLFLLIVLCEGGNSGGFPF